MRKPFGLLVSLVLALAACGGEAAPASPSAAPASPSAANSAAAAKPSAAASAAAPAASAKPAASASAKPAAAASSGGTVKIGLIQPLTSIYANQGKDHVDGFKLYLDSINNTVGNKKIELVVADNQSQVDNGLTKAKQLVESDKVQILAGGSLTPECYAIAPYAKQMQIPFVNTGNCIGNALTLDPKYTGPYFYRLSASVPIGTDPLADWAYKKGYRKAATLVSDYQGGLEIHDAFASAFVQRGGSVIQENYPAQGTTDFGPYLAKLDKSADFVFAFLPGIDGLRMMQQYANYNDPAKLPVIDYGGGITSGPNLADLKDKAVGIVGGATPYVDSIDTPANQAFAKAWKAKYPDRLVDADADRGYDGSGFIVAAIKAANGDVDNHAADGPFVKAMEGLQYDAARGKMKLDKDHDIVQNSYIQQVVKEGNNLSFKILQSYENVGKEWDRTRDELIKFPFGKLKGKWIGMTKDTLPKS